MDLIYYLPQVFVPISRPYAQPATRIALAPYSPTYVKVRGDTGYPEMLAALWKRGTAFIIVEQDVVPWPGAIEELQSCPKPWCAFAYDKHYRMERGAPGDAVYLGCAKFSDELIAATPYVWSDWMTAHWASVDTRISAIARSSGFDVHQHQPGVVNANPNLLEGQDDEPQLVFGRAKLQSRNDTAE